MIKEDIGVDGINYKYVYNSESKNINLFSMGGDSISDTGWISGSFLKRLNQDHKYRDQSALIASYGGYNNITYIDDEKYSRLMKEKHEAKKSEGIEDVDNISYSDLQSLWASSWGKKEDMAMMYDKFSNQACMRKYMEVVDLFSEDKRDDFFSKIFANRMYIGFSKNLELVFNYGVIRPRIKDKGNIDGARYSKSDISFYSNSYGMESVSNSWTLENESKILDNIIHYSTLE